MITNTNRHNYLKMYLYQILLTAVVFLGSFLLFISEPLIGRLLLPFLGGSIHIWLICLTFFQGMLLLGYLCAHLIARKIRFWHLFLFLLPLVRLPFAVPTEPSAHSPIFSLLLILLNRFSLPFVILSTTVVLIQSWLSRSEANQFYEPYSLYAASNAGSLAGLLGYAFLIEPQMGLRVQTVAWTAGYLCFLVLITITWYSLRPGPEIASTEDLQINPGESTSRPTGSDYGTWILLSSLPSAFLLAVTNFISMEIGSFPLIWVLPLSLYLASFIVTFRPGGGVPRLLNIGWPEVLLLALTLYFVRSGNIMLIFGDLACFTIVCVASHGRLYEKRPPTRWLTGFYLTTAIGGFLGGVSMSIAAPLIFNRYYEYLLLILLFGALFWQLRGHAFRRFWKDTSTIIVVGRILILVLLSLQLLFAALPSGGAVKFRYRNFYGMYRICDYILPDHPEAVIRALEHGKTVHGAQILAPPLQMIPVYCYYRGGGFPDAYETAPRPLRSAIIGLGAGVVCAYAQPQDTFVFFEIDPDNDRIAKQWFTYLSKCKGEVKVIHGDGRLSLRDYREDSGRFDVITVDAFSGDGIPVHLLTREAIDVYLSRLKDDGVILFHISNRYYHLFPVVKSTIAELNLWGAINVLIPHQNLSAYQMFPGLVAVARNPDRLKPLLTRGWVGFSEKDGLPKVKPWTDDYINVIAPLMQNIKNVGFFRLGSSR